MKPAILEVKDVHKSFEGNLIHKGVSFQLREGESLGLLGGSGTGKSVLLRSLIGLEYIDSGEILYQGKRIDHLSEEEYFPIRKEVSYAFQSGALFDSINVFENIAFPLFEHTNKNEDIVAQEVERVLELVDMKGKQDLLPSDLSGGMQKRVGLARSIILNPKIVLYDEPTAGLDPSNTQNVIEIMNRLKSQGISSIFVTHDIPAAIKTCDRIVLLLNGKIFFEGTPEEFMQSKHPEIKKFFDQGLKKSHFL